jgi:exosortase A
VLPVFVLFLVAMLLLYRHTALGMVAIWERSETFAHAWLVPPILLWLVWRQRGAVQAQQPRPAPWWVLLALAAAGTAWLLGELAGVNALSQFAFVAMLVLLVPALLGLDVTRVLLFPLAFLFFAVPFGEFLLPQFMEWTADFTVLALRLSGIPVYREGLQFVIPSGNWSVVEACSGIRYLIASFMVGTLFAYLNYTSWRRRLAFMAVSIVVPVLANWVRAYLIVMLGHVSGNRLAVGVDHLIYGWVFFGIVMLLMFMIGSRWSEPLPLARSGAAGAGPAGGAAEAPLRWGSVAAVVLLVLLPPLALSALDRTGAIGVPPLTLPATLGDGWQARDTALAPYKPDFREAAVEFQKTYARADRVVGVYLGYYRNQDQQRKLVSSNNFLVRANDPVWTRVSSGMGALSGGSQPLSVQTMEIREQLGHGADRRLQLRLVYWINGRWTASDTVAKALLALNQLLGRGDDAAVLVVWADRGEPGQAESDLDAFMHANLPIIEATLEAARDGTAAAAQLERGKLQ